MPETPRRIAVLRANGIGDFVFALPALDALRAAYEDAEIVLLGLDWHRDFLVGRPSAVDRVEVVPPYPGVRGDGPPDWLEQEAFFARMAEERFDLALQMHGGGRNSNPFVARLGATRAVGLRTPDAAPLDAHVPYRYFQSEVMRCLEVAALAGGHPVGSQPHLSVTAADLLEARRVIPPTAAPVVALNPGAGDPRRRWPASRFARVGADLAAAGARVVVTGDANDTPLAEEIRTYLPSAIDLTGRLTLGGLAGLFARCAVVVSNDSGPLHLAEAVGARTVGLYWCGNVINAGAAMRGPHRVLMSWRLECPECGIDCMRATCPHEASFIAEIDAKEVAAEALDLFADAVSARPPAPTGTLRAAVRA